jgi:6-phospho-3-hexuloisomerase
MKKQLKPTAHPKVAGLSIHQKLEAILQENHRLLKSLRDKTVEDFIHRLLGARAIFFSAQGRSGFILRCFCMRLMHLGYQVYFCGETITPAIEPEDMLIVLSGSGETPSTLEAVKVAKRQKVFTFGVVGNIESPIASLVDRYIHLPGTTKLRRDSEPYSLQMAGSLFEQAAFIFLEAIILTLNQERLERVDSLSPRHAVIE